MDLFEIAFFTIVAAQIAGGFFRAGAGRGEVAEMRLGLSDDGVVIEIAGGRQDHRSCAVMIAHIAGNGLAAEGADQLGGAQDRAPDRLVRKGGGLEMVEDDVVGRVYRLADLLHHHRLLAGQLVGIEAGILQDVGQDIDA